MTWILAAEEVHSLLGHSGEGILILMRQITRLSLVSLGVFLVSLLIPALALPAPPALKPSDTSGPSFKNRLTLWPKNLDQPKPWRDDPRLKDQFYGPDLPDDIKVLFLNPDLKAPGKNEKMWVTVIDYDPKTDLFLGILVNSPVYLTDIADRDNVLFRFEDELNLPIAVNMGQGYRAAALPRTKAPEFLAKLVEGVRAYRQGDFGRNPTGTEACIEILNPAVKNIPTAASSEERFAAHFVLARCLSDAHSTRQAIEQFKAAIVLEPNDVDAQMGLLAELSVMAHPPLDAALPADQDLWDKAFLDQLDSVRFRFASHPWATRSIGLLFDEKQAGDLSKYSEAALSRMRKLGFGPMQWKRR